MMSNRELQLVYFIPWTLFNGMRTCVIVRWVLSGSTPGRCKPTTLYIVNLRTHPEHMSSPRFLAVFVLLDLQFYVYVLLIVVCPFVLFPFDNCVFLSLFDLWILITLSVSSNSSSFFLVKPTTKMSNLICPTCGSLLLFSYLIYNVISRAFVNVFSCNPRFIVLYKLTV